MNEINLKLKTYGQLTMEIEKLQIDILCKDKEIERLNKELDTSIEICNNRQKEIVRLNNIINELKGSDKE